jgi:hypothetical protein
LPQQGTGRTAAGTGAGDQNLNKQVEVGNKVVKSMKNCHTIIQEILMDPMFKELLVQLQNDIIKLTIPCS